MKIISWDIGFHHLSYAIFSFLPNPSSTLPSQIQLLHWKVWSINEQLCSYQDSKTCCSVSKWFLEEPIFSFSPPPSIHIACSKHQKDLQKKSETFPIDIPEIYFPCTAPYRNATCHSPGIISSTPLSAETIETKAIYQTCDVHKKKWEHAPWKKEKTSSQQDWITWGKRIFHYLDQHSELWEGMDHILIENQPALKNPIMKTYQAMLSSYYMMKSMHTGYDMKIHLLSASNKNKIPSPSTLFSSNTLQWKKKEKTTYAENKQNSIHSCLEWLDYFSMTEWKSYIESLTKQDDVADSFLQGLYFILNQSIVSKKKKESIDLPI